MSHKNKNLFFLNYSISPDSGGRVQSMYLRGKVLEDDVNTITICTFNFRPHYQDVFDEIREKKN